MRRGDRPQLTNEDLAQRRAALEARSQDFLSRCPKLGAKALPIAQARALLKESQDLRMAYQELAALEAALVADAETAETANGPRSSR